MKREINSWVNKYLLISWIFPKHACERALIIPAQLWLRSQRFSVNPVFLSYSTAAPHAHQIKYETVTRRWERMRYSEPRKERSGWQPVSLKPASPPRSRFVFTKSRGCQITKDPGCTNKISGCVAAVTPAAPQNDVQTQILVEHQLWWNNLTFH